mgnify:CR=1 FL=1
MIAIFFHPNLLQSLQRLFVAAGAISDISEIRGRLDGVGEAELGERLTVFGPGLHYPGELGWGALGVMPSCCAPRAHARVFDLWQEGRLWDDLSISIRRMLLGWAIGFAGSLLGLLCCELFQLQGLARQVTLVMSAAPAVTLRRTWDRTLIPLPFSRVVVVYGRPQTIGVDLRGPRLADKCREVETLLNRLRREADRRGRQHQPGSQPCDPSRHDIPCIRPTHIRRSAVSVTSIR